MVKSEERWRCKRCDKPFSIKSCSWLKCSKLSLETIWLLLWCWQNKVPVDQTSKIVCVSLPAVYHWFDMFRSKVPEERINSMLKGDIACDEMYTKDCSIIGAKEKGTKKIALRVIRQKSVQRQHAIDFLTQFVEANSKVCTDGASIYKGMGNWTRLEHEYEIHKRFEFTLTAEIEGVWANFRTFVRRMYHHVTKYKLENLVAEFCLRFSHDEIFESPDRYWEICLGTKPFAL